MFLFLHLLLLFFHTLVIYIYLFLKEKLNIKDTGNIIPGHGGLLDRIDSWIISFPFAFIIFILD